MDYRSAFRTGAVTVLSYFVIPWSDLLGDSTIAVKGRVLHSFDDPHALIQTKAYVARIVLANIPERQRRDLRDLGAEVNLVIPRAAIDIIWPVRLGPESPVVVDAPRPPDGILASGGKNEFQLRGRILPAIGASDRLIQAGAYIYRVNIEALSDEARSALNASVDTVSVALPTKAVLFAWKAQPAPTPGPHASTKPDAAPKPSAGKIVITGRALASFSEPHALIQADGKIYQLRKEDLTDKEISILSRVGNDVSVQVPANSVSLAWPAR